MSASLSCVARCTRTMSGVMYLIQRTELLKNLATRNAVLLSLISVIFWLYQRKRLLSSPTLQGLHDLFGALRMNSVIEKSDLLEANAFSGFVSM